MGREEHLQTTLNLNGNSVTKKVSDARILVVGAGGIGCELLKVLVLSGFQTIEIVDLDTIDVSNLNRQFLFRRQHVGMCKAKVAAEEVLKFNSKANIVSHHGNIKDKKFGAEYIQNFDLIFNALDNIEARRHVNRVCIAVDKPLIDGGTQGYDGQVVTIKRGVTACYDCEPKPAPKGFAVCTIRSTPDKPIHCIVWAKYLFGLLFGVKDDQNSVTEGVDVSATALELVKKLFVDDINKLISMENLWKSRKPPEPLQLSPALTDVLNSTAATDRAGLDDHKAWSIETTCAVLAARFETLKARLKETPSLEFDKDDDEAMDFVLCASNLRSRVFGIEEQCSFRCKDIAGNIIPAIATTNAIIAGMMVLEAFKVLDGRLQDCRTQYKNREPTGRKSLLLIPSDPDPPNPACPVCGGQGSLALTLNTHKTPFRFLLERVLRQELGLSEPQVDTGDNLIECWRHFDDEHEARRLEALLALPLSDAAVGIAHNAELAVEDEGQQVKLKLLVFHDDAMDPDGERQFHLDRRGAAADAPPSAAAAAAAAAGSGSGAPAAAEAAAAADDVLCAEDEEVVIVDGPGASADAGSKRAREGGGGGGQGGAEGHETKRARA